MHQTIVIGKTLIKDGNTTRMNLQLINVKKRTEMDIDKFINSTIKSYDEYRKNCDIIAKEAQRYIAFDNFVSCEYINGVGLSILVTLPETDDYDIPECVCPVVGFFEYAKGKDKLSVDDIKKLSL